MSTKIYNGYKFKENFELRDLNKKMIELREILREKAYCNFISDIINDFLYLYDIYHIKGKEQFDIEYSFIFLSSSDNKFLEQKEILSWKKVFWRIYFDSLKKIKNKDKNDLFYEKFNYNCSIQILPIKDKILFTLYTEKNFFENAIGDQSYIEEYHYQNQTDHPEDISDEDWEQRRKDWDEALIEGIASNNGFNIEFINTLIFPLPNIDKFLSYNPIIQNLEERAKLIAQTDPYPEFTGKNLSVFRSEKYKKFKAQKSQEYILLLEDFSSAENMIKTIFKKDQD